MGSCSYIVTQLTVLSRSAVAVNWTFWLQICVVILPVLNLLLVKGLCHMTESNLFLFLFQCQWLLVCLYMYIHINFFQRDTWRFSVVTSWRLTRLVKFCWMLAALVLIPATQILFLHSQDSTLVRTTLRWLISVIG